MTSRHGSKACAHFPKFAFRFRATFFTNFGKSEGHKQVEDSGTACRSEVPERTRRLWYRDFRSAVPVRRDMDWGEHLPAGMWMVLKKRLAAAYFIGKIGRPSTRWPGRA
jgi:hypothetical protein